MSDGREIMPIKERIRQFRWKLDGREIPMGIGCAYVGEKDKKPGDGLALLDRCYEEGFRYFDTSRSYHESEPVVGDFIRHIDRNTIFLSTKSHYAPRAFGKMAMDRFKRNFFESFERLHTDHIDLFLIHDTDNIEMCVDEVVPFLREQREKGLIDYIGLGTRCLNAQREGLTTGLIDASECYLSYSLLKRSGKSVADIARANNRAYINASLLHFGVIKDPDPVGSAKSHPYSWYRRHAEMAAKMQVLCREMNVDIVAASLQYSMLDPAVDVVLNGVNRMSNIDSTLRSMRTVIWPEQWARIRALQDTDPMMDLDDQGYW